MEVQSQLGAGFLEAVYQEALGIEFVERAIPFRQQVELPIQFKGKQLQAEYRADFLCYESVVVEIKALARLTTAEESQVINYLKASGHPIGLLLNFGSKSLEYRRFAN